MAHGTVLAPDLIEAYRGARYVIWNENGSIRLRIEDPAPWPIRRWLGHAAGAVFVTAAAPRGIPRHALAERAAFRRLAAQVMRLGARFLVGEGSDEARTWPAEASLLIALKRRALASAWGRRLGQNAVLWVPRRGAISLVLLRRG